MDAAVIKTSGSNVDLENCLGDVALKMEIRRLQHQLDEVTSERDQLVAFRDVSYRRKLDDLHRKYFAPSKWEIRKRKLKHFLSYFIVKEED